MKKKQLFVTFWVLFLLPALQAQEVLTGLPSNPAVHQRYLQSRSQAVFKTSHKAIALQLPFFDDFKTSHIYPDARLWSDKDVFVNNHFCFLPPDRGVATFDALDSAGNIYSGATSVSFKADRLTSQPVRLDSVFSPSVKALSPADSVYLSFYYQPQGTADAPEEGDSLVLKFLKLTGDTVFSHIDSVWVSANRFLSGLQDTLHPGDTLRGRPPCDTAFYLVNYSTLVWGDSLLFPCDSVFTPETVWKTVWKTPGMSLQDFREKYGKNFVQVMVPLRDSGYFFNGFRFRFWNYVSIANSINPAWQSNVDQWNVDYVYLNTGRFAGDTTHRALAFSGTAPDFLKSYTEMPYRQYRSDPTNSMRPDFHVYMANLDRVAHNVHYFYRVTQVNGSFAYGYDGGNCVLKPFYETGFQDCSTGCGAAQACPPVNSLFSLDYDRDTTSYVIRHYISDSSVSPPLVDSMVYRQGFYNEFAYDDGTPELGYTLEPAGAELAYRFKLKAPDTLRALRIYFNKTAGNAAPFFDIMIWRDNNGKPGEVIYRQNNQKVFWEKGLYPFSTYKLDSALVVSGTFYVGYRQQNQSLNVGFDANHDAGKNIFYFAESHWYPTSFHGALLMRPVLGQDMILGTETVSKTMRHLSVYPNPVNGVLHLSGVRISGRFPARIAVYDLTGRLVIRKLLTDNILETGGLKQGLYLLRLGSGTRIFYAKFIVKH
jgi:hypothetical protein